VLVPKRKTQLNTEKYTDSGLEKASNPPQKELFQIGGEKFLVIDLVKKFISGIWMLLKSFWASD